MPEMEPDIAPKANWNLCVCGWGEGQKLGVGRIVSRKSSHSWGQLNSEGIVVPGHAGKCVCVGGG